MLRAFISDDDGSSDGWTFYLDLPVTDAVIQLDNMLVCSDYCIAQLFDENGEELYRGHDDGCALCTVFESARVVQERHEQIGLEPK